MNRKILIFLIFIIVAIVLVAVKINLSTEIAREYFPENGDVEKDSAKDLAVEIKKQVEVEKESEEVAIKDKPFLKEEKSIKQIVYGFLGTPYERGPLGEKEEERIYRTDVFDCTTLVLVVASKFNSNGVFPEEIIKQANYYPSDQISYESRLHFSSYRNQVSPLFRDITEEIGKEKTKTKQVVLNKDRGEEGRIIDINWEREINLKYIAKEDVPEIISFLPSETGVAFMVDGDEKIGLDIRHEGFLFNGEKLVHASSNRGEVFEEDFLDFFDKSNYTGVIFFEIVAIDHSL